MISTALLCLTLTTPAGQDVRPIGPSGQGLVDIVASRRSDSIALAIHSNGQVFRTGDQGRSYGAEVLDLDLDGAAGRAYVNAAFDSIGVAFVAGRTQLHRSGDGGRTWTPVATGLHGDVLALETDPQVPGRLWAVVRGFGLMRSEDGGASWLPIGPGTTVWSAAIDHAYISFDPLVPERVVLGIGRDRLWLSADDGATWDERPGTGTLPSNSTLDDVRSVAGRLVALVLRPVPFVADRFPTIWTSLDEGSTWQHSGPFNEFTLSARLEVDPRDPTSIWALAPLEPGYRSTDGGASFHEFEVGATRGVVDVAFPSLPSTHLLCFDGSGLGRVRPDAPEFEAARVDHAATPPTEVDRAFIDPRDEDHVVAESYQAIHETHDGGEHWTRLPLFLPPATPIGAELIGFDGSGAPLLGGPSIQRWNGSAWETLFDGPLDDVAIGRLDPDLIRGIRQTLPAFAGHEIVGSDDGGLTWWTMPTTLPAPVPPGGSINGIELVERPGLPHRLVVAARAGLSQSLVSFSDDDGAAWTDALLVDASFSRWSWSLRDPARCLITDGSTTWLTEDAFGSATSLPAASDAFMVGVADGESGYMVTSKGFPGGFEIAESFDGGATFSPVDGLSGEIGLAVGLDVAPSRSWMLVRGFRTGLFRADIEPLASEVACVQSTPNSVGALATLSVFGSTSIQGPAPRLDVVGLPPLVTCLPLASMTEGFLPNPGGSLGDLCLGGAIGRFNGAIASASVGGTLSFQLDPAALPQPAAFVPATAGSAWTFQCWHRDVDGTGAPASHFSSAARVTWTD